METIGNCSQHGILLITNGSEDSETALRATSDLACRTGSKVCIALILNRFHWYDTYLRTPQDVIDRWCADARQMLSKQATTLASKGVDVQETLL